MSSLSSPLKGGISGDDLALELHSWQPPLPPPTGPALDADTAESPIAVDEPVRRPRRAVGKNLVTMLGTQILSWSVALVLVTVLPRFLGPTEMGTFVLAWAVWATASVIVNSSTQAALTMAVARDAKAGAALIGPVIMARVGSFIVVSVAVLGGAALFGVDHDLFVLLVLVGTVCFSTSINSVFIATLQGLEEMGSSAKSDIIASVVDTIAVVAALSLIAQRASTAVAASAAVAVFQCAVSYAFVRRHVRVVFDLDVRAAVMVLRRGVPYLLGGAVFIAYRQMDIFVMSGLVNHEQLGWYAAADRLIGTAMFLPGILGTVTFPLMTRMHHSDPAAARALTTGTARTMIALAIAEATVLLLLSDALAPIVFGDDFAQAGPVLAVGGLVLMATFLTTLIGQFAYVTGRERVILVTMLGATIATIPLDMVFVPFCQRHFANGAIGGQMSFVVTEMAILLITARIVIPELLCRATLVRVAKCLVAASTTAAAVWPVRHEFPLIGMGIAAVVYCVTFVALKPFEPQEQQMIERYGNVVALRSPRAARIIGRIGRIGRLA